MRGLLVIVAVALLSTTASAHPPVSSPSLEFLPPDGIVTDLLTQDPVVRRAGAMLGSAEAEARARDAGPYEFTVHGEYHSRATSLEGRLDEWGLGVSRGIRLPGKADADEKIGRYTVEVAQNGYGDARHQAATLLKQLWLSWVLAEKDVELAQAEVSSYERQLAAMERSRQLGHSAALDVDQVRAAAAQAQVQVTQAEQTRRDARMTLARSFPTLALPPAAPEMPAPSALPGTGEDWQSAVLDDNHEIKLARSEADRRDWLARRAHLDQFADPTVDLRTFQEMGGHETGFGIGLSIPLGGALRRASADQASAEAVAASVTAHKVQRDVEIAAERDVINAQQSLQAWHQAEMAAGTSKSMVARMQKAYELGDLGLTDLLVARRQDYDVRRTEIRARGAAHSAVLQLLIDSHRIWGLSEEEHQTHSVPEANR
jgi:outer membrane protein TolC